MSIAATCYLRFAFPFRRAAQRAFINCERRLRPAAVIPPFPFFLAGFAPPRPALNLAQRARAAAAIFDLADVDNRRFPPRERGAAAVGAPAPVPPTKLLSRLSNASI